MLRDYVLTTNDAVITRSADRSKVARLHDTLLLQKYDQANDECTNVEEGYDYHRSEWKSGTVIVFRTGSPNA